NTRKRSAINSTSGVGSGWGTSISVSILKTVSQLHRCLLLSLYAYQPRIESGSCVGCARRRHRSRSNQGLRRHEMVNNGSQQVVVIGSSFAGLTAALELRKHLDKRHRVVVLDRRPDFTFIPSLVWLPFGKRQPEDITFPLAPVYERKGIEFRNTAATGFDLENRIVHTDDGQDIPYDKLMFATGPRLAFEKVPG